MTEIRNDDNEKTFAMITATTPTSITWTEFGMLPTRPRDFPVSGIRHRLGLNFVPVMLLALVLLLALSCLVTLSQAQVSWTPIYVDTSNQVDLWTLKERGCPCPDDPSSTNCACCVQPGGCLCTFHNNKCAQCGLQDACQRFCNVTISSWKIASQSGLSWVQLKSPTLQGPTTCWWRIEAVPGQRIEIQIHRLISVGSYDNSTQKCSRGFVQFSAGDIILPSSQAIELCGENSRFSPPLVFFADQGIATLYLRIEGKSTRSQLLGYASFPSADDPVVGDPSKGGRQRAHSGCDWSYDNCWTHDCILTSPGYPGLVQPFRRCRYHLNANTTTQKIRIVFQTLNFLPSHNKCTSHHLAVWKLNSSLAATTALNPANLNLANIPPWKLLCEDSDSVVDVNGAHAVLEYRSGSSISPYVHNGFRAKVQFILGPVGFVTIDEAEERRIEVAVPPTTAVRGMSGTGIGNGRSAGGRSTMPKLNNATTTIETVRTKTRDRNGNSRTPATTTTTTTTTLAPAPAPPVPVTLSPRRQNGLTGPGSTRSQYTGYGPGAEGVYPISCGHIFDGELTRGHVFRLLVPKDLTLRPPTGLRAFGTYINGNGNELVKKPPPGPFKCQIEFRGRATDIVQFAAFSYKFRGSNCSTSLLVYDMEIDLNNSDNRNDRLLGKMCGPTGHEVKHFTSSHNRLAMVTLLYPEDDVFGSEFLEGAFRFHDESIEGTVKPMSSCEVVYYGVTSAASGTLTGPPDSPLLVLSTFPLVCAYTFMPSLNQTVTLTLNGAGHDSIAMALPNSFNYCRTICGNSGCQCEAKYTPLDQIDHMLLLSGISTPVACLCGYFKDILPLAFESHIPLTLLYHAAKSGREFSYSVGYQFRPKITCTNFSISPPSSSKRWKEILGPSVQYNNRYNGNLHYMYFQCIWSVSIPTRYKLAVDFISEENEDDCRTWNLTLWAGNNLAMDPTPEDLLFSFCPRDGRKEFQIPENIQHAFLKLVGVTLRPPQFDIRWRYIDVMLGSGFLLHEKIITNQAVTLAAMSAPSCMCILVLLIHTMCSHLEIT